MEDTENSPNEKVESRFTWKHLLAVSHAIIFVVGIYFLPLTNTKKKGEAKVVKTTGFESRLAKIKNKLGEAEKQRLTAIESSLENKDIADTTLKLLGQYWDSLGHPAISANYYEKIALKNPGEKTYLNAAYRYFDAYKMLEAEEDKKEMVDKAIECYSKVLTFNDQNLDARCDLGVLYAEGTSEPMKGIMMLREVVQKNPKHENAQMNLGLLSLKSNQLPKAIDRFKKLVEINPLNEKAWILLANTYLQTDKKDSAILAFTQLRNVTKNIEMKNEIDEYILQIKQGTNLKNK